mgnify:CR=1 FL=1
MGAKYYQGNRSPNNAEREDIGYSSAWLHHKGRNRHHYEYWTDYDVKSDRGNVAPVAMPARYVVEMLMDRIAASKIYLGDAYRDDAPLQYYLGAKEPPMIHPKTRRQLEKLLHMVAQKGERATFAWIKKRIRAGRGTK